MTPARRPRAAAAPILLVVLVSCGPEEEDPLARREAETRRAFQLEAEADLVIEYESDESVDLFPRGARRDRDAFPAAELEQRLAAVETPKALCVVIIGKYVQHVLPARIFKEKVDRIEDLLRRHGWSRIVVQLGRATGRSIYRE